MGKGGKWANRGIAGGRERRRPGRAALRPQKRSYYATSRRRRFESRWHTRLTEQVAWGLGVKPCKYLLERS